MKMLRDGGRGSEILCVRWGGGGGGQGEGVKSGFRTKGLIT